MPNLPHNLYSASQTRELDRLAASQFALPGATLMARAAQAAFECLRQRWPQAQRLLICCGVGNNAGDGYLLAKLAHAAGLQVRVLQVGEPGRLRGDALAAAEAAGAVGVVAESWQRGAGLPQCDVVVDALLGTGLSGEVHGAWRALIEEINASGRPVLALDIPSGLDADCGAVLGAAVRADLTLSFIALKAGLFTGAGPALCGEVRLDDLQLPAQVYEQVGAMAQRLTLSRFTALLGPRVRDGHKGCYGHVLVVGGDAGMAGAVRLAAEAAARVGAGLVSVATHPGHAASIAMACPELMCHGIETADQLEPLLHRATVVVVGPGLGQAPWGQALLARLLEIRQPLVVDADALNLLAQEPSWCDDWVLTPHPGEAGRLLGESAADVQRNRFAAAAGLQASYGGVVVLKGPGTVVLAGDGMPGVCSGGNPGMASGGMGDVLSGVIAGLIAQGLDLRSAAAAGVCLHAAAADAAAAEGERGLLASDLFPHLRRLVNP